MLVVTMEIWPWGTKELKYQIGEITAANITALGPVSAYEVRVHQGAYDEAGVAEFCEGFVLRDHPSSAGPLALIQDALVMAVPNSETPLARPTMKVEVVMTTDNCWARVEMQSIERVSTRFLAPSLAWKWSVLV